MAMDQEHKKFTILIHTKSISFDENNQNRNQNKTSELDDQRQSLSFSPTSSWIPSIILIFADMPPFYVFWMYCAQAGFHIGRYTKNPKNTKHLSYLIDYLGVYLWWKCSMVTACCHPRVNLEGADRTRCCWVPLPKDYLPSAGRYLLITLTKKG